ncbi:VPA1262 family N-terminal domain-containing protein [Pseudomonas aeruginosa]|uniref:VPA1262 family N-terminal domain-containing protein n=1 Tax=Pseudomonas aeruginosa TaxID=287 RepID=UPI000F7F6B48|nr:VPA1262 family N-terminal domain-containing protein [Pseudomonas aeruginosa]RTB44116.1 hypothetical protein EJ655_08235 [Pseudomonas aeruginosa]
MHDTPLLLSDYKHAVVQVVALLHEKTCHLVFACAELLPAEMPRPPDEKYQSIQLKKMKGQPRLFYLRYIVSAVEAYDWYEQCRNGKFSLLGDEATKYPTSHNPLIAEPAWPSLIVGSQFPVTGETASTARTHHLYPATTPTILEQMFQAVPDTLSWISERLYCDLARYPELAGSVHLLAPNPLFRHIGMRLHVADGGIESTVLEITPRTGMSSSGIEAYVIEHRPTGISAIEPTVFQGEPRLLVQHKGIVDQVEVMIRCPRRGLLEWEEPTGYIRHVHVRGHIAGAAKTIMVPAGQTSLAESYTTSRHEKGWSTTIGAAPEPVNISAHIRARASDRRRVDEAKRLGQQWFHRSRIEATNFVRALIASACQRVWIVDPYFATRELFSFALATRGPEISVLIVSGAETSLTKEDETAPSIEAGESLLNIISHHPAAKNIKAKVLTGDKPEIHDRFLVIDDAVWFTGNSLNKIGVRAGMIISLPDPKPVIEQLSGIINDESLTKDLRDWVVQRATAKTIAPKTGETND